MQTHNEKTHLTRARYRLSEIGAVRSETYDEVSIRSRRHTRSAQPNCSTVTARKRQQPGFRCSGRVMCHVTPSIYPFLPPTEYAREKMHSRHLSQTQKGLHRHQHLRCPVLLFQSHVLLKSTQKNAL
jgi:hypothetical protein